MKEIEKAQKQLDHFHSGVIYGKNLTIQTRKWAIAIWFAAVIGIVSGKIVDLSNLMEYVILLVPILSFWVLEGFQTAWLVIDFIKMDKIEKFIHNHKDGDDEEKFPISLYYTSSYESIEYFEKLKIFIRAIVRSENLWLFYGLLAALSILFIKYK